MVACVSLSGGKFTGTQEVYQWYIPSSHQQPIALQSEKAEESNELLGIGSTEPILGKMMMEPVYAEPVQVTTAKMNPCM